MFTPFLPMAIGLAAQVGAQNYPRLLNRDELVTARDYPAIAADEEQQGTTTVRLKVNRNGFVESCKIVESSGHQALDEQSCAVYRARARYEPARDSAGRPVASEYQQRVVWRLAGDRLPPMPRQAWMGRTTAGMTAERMIVSCKVEAVGLPSPPDCKDLMRMMEDEGFLAEKGASATEFSTREIHFYPLPVDRITPPPWPLGIVQQGEQISEITIGSDGAGDPLQRGSLLGHRDC